MATIEDRIDRHPRSVKPPPAGRARAPQITLTIDDQQVICDAGETILEAAQRVGIHIPTLCYEPRLPASPPAASAWSRSRARARWCRAAPRRGRRHGRAHRHRARCARCATSTSSCCSPTTTRSARRPAATPARRTSRSRSSSTTSPTATTRTACASCARTCRSRPSSAASARGPARARAAASWSSTPSPSAGCTASWPTSALDEEQTGELLLPVEPKPDTGKRIAIVGAGPAGLACAFYARLEGHAVKIFEALPHAGGMLRYGIPSYRLPRDLIDKEINVLWRMGVELQCDTRLGVDFQLEDLTAQLRRRVPRSRRLRFQRDGRRQRGRRRRRLGRRLPRRARAQRRRARRRQGHRHRRRLHRHGRLPHLGAQRRQRGHLPLPPLAQGDAGPPHRGRRGRGRGREARAARRPGAHPRRRRPQGHRHRDAAHGARRARRLRPSPAGADRGLRVRRRVRPGDRRHRPVPDARRHERGAGRQAHEVEDDRRRRVHLPDRRSARVRRRRRGARRADRDPGGRPGQEGGLEHRRLLARRRHARGLARARRAPRDAVLQGA